MQLQITDILFQIETILNHQGNRLFFLGGYLAFILITVTLRVMSHLHLKGALITLQLEARKELASQKDVANLRNSLLRKTSAEYIRMANKSVTNIPTEKLANFFVSNMNLMGWKYDNIFSFVLSMETGLLLVGILLAITFTQYTFMYATLAILAFLLTRIFSAFFNGQNVKTQLVDELTLFVEREIGRFFAADSGSAILRLKNDLTEAINNQSKIYKETMDDINNSMTHALTTVATNTSTTHVALNDAADRLAHSSSRLQSSTELLATHLKSHSNTLSEEILALVTAANGTKDSLNNLITLQHNLADQAKYIEKNQHTLEASLTAYEGSLKNLTQSIGDGIGAFVNIHAQTAAQTIDETLKSNLDKIINLTQRSENS